MNKPADLARSKRLSKRSTSGSSTELKPVSGNGRLQSVSLVEADSLSSVLATADAVGDSNDFVSKWWLDVLFLICGVSVFARTEAFFMQTDLFAECFELGVDFYPIACGLAFVPGVFVTMLQNAYDIGIDRKYGTRKAHLIRLLVSATVSVALIVGYFAAVTVEPKLRKSMFLIGPVLMLIGVAATITWGSVTQITSSLPGKFQTYVFIGSMSPFALYLPTNILLGDLCVKTNASRNLTINFPSIFESGGGGDDVVAEMFGPPVNVDGTAAALRVSEDDMAAYYGIYGNATPPPSDQQYEAQMSKVEIFFSMCCILTVLGCAAISAAITCSSAVKRRLLKRDASLRQAEKAAENIYEDTALSESSPLVQGGGDAVAAHDSATEQAMTQVEVAKIVWAQALSQLLVSVASQLVVSQYVSVPKRYYKSQTTMLLYEYYIGSMVGMVVALWKRARIGPKGLLTMSIVRFAVFPLALLYITHPDALGPKGSKKADIITQFINIIFTFTNGYLFSITYSQANALFKSPAGASRASSTLSVMYYLAISIAIGASILINRAMCGSEPGGCPNMNRTDFSANHFGGEDSSLVTGVGSGSSYYLWDRSFGHFDL